MRIRKERERQREDLQLNCLILRPWGKGRERKGEWGERERERERKERVNDPYCFLRAMGGETSHEGDFLVFEGNHYRNGFMYKNFVMSAIVSISHASCCQDLHSPLLTITSYSSCMMESNQRFKSWRNLRPPLKRWSWKVRNSLNITTHVHVWDSIPYSLAKLAICYSILHFGY